MAYQRILQLTYVEDLLTALKTLFIKYYEPFLTAFVASLHALNTARTEATSWDFGKALEGWDTIFDKVLRGFEEKAAMVRNFMLSAKNLLTMGFRSANLASRHLLALQQLKNSARPHLTTRVRLIPFFHEFLLSVRFSTLDRRRVDSGRTANRQERPSSEEPLARTRGPPRGSSCQERYG